MKYGQVSDGFISKFLCNPQGFPGEDSFEAFFLGGKSV